MATTAGPLVCPVHGPVEGLGLSEGPLSNCWPWVLVCEKCDGDGNTIVVGYESDDGTFDRWEEVPVEEAADGPA